jgi:hypothetical protein
VPHRDVPSLLGGGGDAVADNLVLCLCFAGVRKESPLVKPRGLKVKAEHPCRDALLENGVEVIPACETKVNVPHPFFLLHHGAIEFSELLQDVHAASLGINTRSSGVLDPHTLPYVGQYTGSRLLTVSFTVARFLGINHHPIMGFPESSTLSRRKLSLFAEGINEALHPLEDLLRGLSS